MASEPAAKHTKTKIPAKKHNSPKKSKEYCKDHVRLFLPNDECGIAKFRYLNEKGFKKKNYP